MAGKSLRTSFDAGEISPELLGRIDLAKFQSGLAACRNFITRPHGPAINRPGTEFVGEVHDSSKAVRLIPFIESPIHSYALEFGSESTGIMRAHTEGGTVLGTTGGIISTITAASPAVATFSLAHGLAVDQMIFAQGFPGDFAVLNNRWLRVKAVVSSTQVSLKDEYGVDIDTTGFAAYSGPPWATLYAAFTLATNYTEADLPDLRYAQSGLTLTVTVPRVVPNEFTYAGGGTWTRADMTLRTELLPVSSVTVTPTGTGTTTHYYKVYPVSASGEEAHGTAGIGSANNAAVLSSTNYNKITCGLVTGAERYRIYKMASGGLFGLIGEMNAPTAGFIDDGYPIDLTQGPPLGSEPADLLFDSADNYPATVCYYEQRRVFAATNNGPQHTWMTPPGRPHAYTYYIPGRDDDALAFEIAAVQNSTIQHLVPLNDLLIFTDTGEWRVNAAGGVLTPTTVQAKMQGSAGASSVAPIVTENDVLSVRARGGHVSAMQYTYTSDSYTATDLSVYAPHLFDGHEIVDWTLQRTPHPTVWAVRDDGVLLGMTYMRDQEVLAWHRHDTKDGIIENVCAVPESNNEDMLYMVVRRTVNGQTKRYVERLASRQFATIDDAFFVDCGVTYSGAATTTITGLNHLEGEAVVALADGNVVPGLTVTDGAVTLPEAASTVHVGLQITAELETLPLAVQTESLAQAEVKNVNRVEFRVDNAREFQVGPDADHLRAVSLRTGEAWGEAVDPQAGMIDVLIDGAYTDDGSVLVRQTNPVPLSILAMIIEADIGD